MSEYPYPFFNEKSQVHCQLCGKAFLVISPTHLSRKHNVKYKDYVKRYPLAPLTSDEFIARGKYGKNKDLFPQDEIGAEQLVDEFEPEIEELNVEKLLEKYQPLSPMEAMKNRIRDHLKLHFSNIKQDYTITQYGPDERLKFEFITDFCDPILKVVVQFPDTFWHNQEAGIDHNKNLKLSQYGWKVIEIPTNNPSFELIDKMID